MFTTLGVRGLVARIRTVSIRAPFSEGERGQGGVVPRWFVTSDAQMPRVDLCLQWTGLAVWFSGCSVQEC